MVKTEFCKRGSNFSFSLRLRNTVGLEYVLLTMSGKWHNATPEEKSGRYVGGRGRRKNPENWKLTEEIHKYIATVKQ